MELLVIILNKTELINDLMLALVEEGINKATVLDSEGMGRFLANEVPIFAGLRQLVGEGKSYNKTILAVTEESGIVARLQKLCNEIGLDFTQPGTGIMFTLPIGSSVKTESKN